MADPLTTFAPRVFNVTLHGVGQPHRPLQPGEDRVWLSTSALERVLDEARGRRDLRITVDDGNRSDTQILLRELERRELTATFFVVAARLGQDDFVSAQDVEAILSAGHAIGSHGMRHLPWRGLERHALEEELETAKELLEAVAQRTITIASCPFGSYDRRMLRRARELGYEHLFTSDGGPADARAWLQPRTTISSAGRPSIVDIANPSRAEIIVARAKRRVKQCR